VTPPPVEEPPLARLWQGVVAAEWPGQRPIHAFFGRVVEVIESHPAGSVVVAGGSQADVLAALVSTTWPEITVHPVRIGDDPSATHARLSATAPFDAVLQLADTTADEQVDLFQRLFLHLDVDGVYLTPRVLPAGEPEAGQGEPEPVLVPNEDLPPGVPFRDLWSLVSAAQAARLDDFAIGAADESTFRDVRGLGRHLSEVRVESKVLRIVNGRRTQAKLTESEADEVLRRHPRLGTEVASRPPATVEAPDAETHNLARDPYFHPRMTSPKMALRRYERPICSRGQVVTNEHYLFPDSFRHHRSARLTNIYIEESAPRFGYVRRDVSRAQDLPGNWFHLDSEWPDEFGHFTTEGIGRLWAWEEAKRLAPDVKVLLTFKHDREPKELTSYARDVLAVFGIGPDDVHVFEEPCRPERLYSATSMFSSTDYIHPDIARVWDHIAGKLAPDDDGTDPQRRIFCTRPIELKRSCHNTPEVEGLFAEQGFEIISPETLTFAEQIRLFRESAVIGGFAGSALFTTAFCDRPKTVLTIGPDSYTARNEHMIAAVRGHHLVSTWCRADTPQPPGSWNKTAFGSAYTFDLERDGAFLRRQLERTLVP
jgi:capsular polysaccharide biosynthesis protein